MRTRAQASRDAALRRLTRLNRTLAIAAVVGTGVITDAVANTATGHAHTVATKASGVEADERPAATVTQAPTRHHTAATSSDETAASSSGTPAASAPSVSTVQPTAVVAVSGGS